MLVSNKYAAISLGNDKNLLVKMNRAREHHDIKTETNTQALEDIVFPLAPTKHRSTINRENATDNTQEKLNYFNHYTVSNILPKKKKRIRE